MCRSEAIQASIKEEAVAAIARVINPLLMQAAGIANVAAAAFKEHSTQIQRNIRLAAMQQSGC